MSYTGKGYSDSSTTGAVEGSSHLKLYQAFIFSVPIFFAFVLLLFFYIFYLRRRRVDWSSLRMRSPQLQHTAATGADELSRCELGLKKEVREMLPIIVFTESFSVKDTQCSVCLGDYQADDRLQQIPVCGHTFHMDCIDLWLATHSTCPLCRQSLLTPAKASTEIPHTTAETSDRTSAEESGDETSRRSGSECPKVGQLNVEPRTTDERVIEPSSQDASEVDNVDHERDSRDDAM
ncbi:RING-H2 finger protein ATL7-like isoform X1 [Nicotiana tomentosiformis]|uniref:RING-H2 finger protein ATL7-like isoform X1 n=2 Tax=Nicotiana tomentosiformis TaxID=4098 RepID=UPI00051C2A9F|nr:RING-H2 finger protein ATL7-like isoform X1 [Nicotiana tomentosiformis]